MFSGRDDPLPEAERDRLADCGVALFLAHYGGQERRPQPGARS